MANYLNYPSKSINIRIYPRFNPPFGYAQGALSLSPFSKFKATLRLVKRPNGASTPLEIYF